VASLLSAGWLGKAVALSDRCKTEIMSHCRGDRYPLKPIIPELMSTVSRCTSFLYLCNAVCRIM
jgi:hypothetical protein